MKTEMVHISKVRAGDSIVCKDGFVRTVTKQNFSYSGFMGIALFGDSYKLGSEMVKREVVMRNTREGMVRES